MRSLFSSSYHRADVLMSAGCSILVSAALIVTIPRFGILLLEILLGLIFIGYAILARIRLRRQALGKNGPRRSKDSTARRLDRYDVLMIVALIVIQIGTAGLLRKAGLSEGTVRILPLILFAIGILFKPRAVEFIESRQSKKKAEPIDADTPTPPSAGGVLAPTGEALTQTVMCATAEDGDPE